MDGNIPLRGRLGAVLSEMSMTTGAAVQACSPAVIFLTWDGPKAVRREFSFWSRTRPQTCHTPVF